MKNGPLARFFMSASPLTAPNDAKKQQIAEKQQKLLKFLTNSR